MEIKDAVLEAVSKEYREAPAPCRDCGMETKGPFPWEFYMLHDEVWAQAGMQNPNGGFLCVGCLEKRLGRPLTAADFIEAPINRADAPWHSQRLASRLSS